MIYSIENEHLKISINQIGAELCKLESAATGKQFLWEGDPAIWGSFAPVLFPVIGAIKDQFANINGQKFEVPRHGFVRNNPQVMLSKQSTNSLTFQLKYDDDTLKIYPFRFLFSITYTLVKNQVEVKHEITNLGEEELLFSVGGHPAFKCPIEDDEKYEDYFIEFEKIENEPTWLLDNNGLVLNESKPLIENSKVIPLDHSLFENDALIFKSLKSNKVSLKNKKSQHVITVSYKDFPYLGIWAKPNGNFVCIEPWLGIADGADSDHDFSTKEGVLTLDSKDNYVATYSIRIQEGS